MRTMSGQSRIRKLCRYSENRKWIDYCKKLVSSLFFWYGEFSYVILGNNSIGDTSFSTSDDRRNAESDFWDFFY